jgi:two-component system chemotaxis response regulator CheY
MKLPNILDFAAAAGLHQSVLGGLKASGRLQIDASEVEVMSLPCMQVILAATREGAVIINPSPAFTEAFETLALELATAVEFQSHPLPIEEPVQEPMQAAPDIEIPAASNGGGMSLRIMTIDDSKTMRDMLMLTLADAGFEVLQAVDGQEGVDMLEKEKVDVVITDINMPRMDGYEVVRQLRMRPEHQKTPILVLTTESEIEKKKMGKDVGATGWLVKPFDPDRLVETVRKVAC